MKGFRVLGFGVMEGSSGESERESWASSELMRERERVCVRFK